MLEVFLSKFILKSFALLFLSSDVEDEYMKEIGPLPVREVRDENLQWGEDSRLSDFESPHFSPFNALQTLIRKLKFFKFTTLIVWDVFATLKFIFLNVILEFLIHFYTKFKMLNVFLMYYLIFEYFQ